MELQILGACLKRRSTYELVVEHLDSKTFSKEYQILIGMIGDFYGRDKDSTHVDSELLIGIMEHSVPNKKHRERFVDILKQASDMDVSASNVDELILKGKLAAIGMQLATSLVNADDKVDGLMEEYARIKGMETLDDLTSKGIDVLTIDNIEEVLNKTAEKGDLLKVYPLAINDRLNGGLGPGHHLVNFARPEMGKTAFNTTIACGFALQGAFGIYFLNEDRLEDVYVRGICCLTGVPESTVLSDMAKYTALARERGFGNIMYVSLSPGTLSDVERFVNQYQPKWVVMDQLRNLAMKEQNKVLQLEYATSGMRNIAKKYALIAVSTTQAGDSAEGKRLLDMGDVDFSNTGVAAQADVLIGVGGNAEDVASGIRYVNISKNKRGGGHAQIPLRINPAISRYSNYTG